jgi:Xaa-Pro aminopeptidase
MQFSAVQRQLAAGRLDGWLVYDFRGSNPVLRQLLPHIGGHLTRRVFLYVPRAGTPTLLCSALDQNQFAKLPDGIERVTYVSWDQLRDRLLRALDGATRVAMEYVPGGQLPVVSSVDAGTVEQLRAIGLEIVSSADLIQGAVAVWPEEAVANHKLASEKVGRVKDAAFEFVADALTHGRKINERDVQKFILDRFAIEGLETPDGPIVGVNQHSGDPHFDVSPTDSSPIERDDWLLIDLWARVPGDANVFSDITWVAYCGDQPLAEHKEVFSTVKRARDAALKLAQESFKNQRPVRGWELDDAARNVIVQSRLGDGVRHRTGHSLSPGPKVHGVGMNLDNLETHDTRLMLPGTGFTIEPGVYQEDFGVRLEINVYVDPQQGPVVTSVIQDDIVRLL